LIPGFDGAVFSAAWKDALWAKFFTGAPARQRRSVAETLEAAGEVVGGDEVLEVSPELVVAIVVKTFGYRSGNV
jgi:urease gamma subunit